MYELLFWDDGQAAKQAERRAEAEQQDPVPVVWVSKDITRLPSTYGQIIFGALKGTAAAANSTETTAAITTANFLPRNLQYASMLYRRDT